MMLGSGTTLDTEWVTAWLGRHGVKPHGQLSASPVAGGLSNLTYLLSDDTGVRWVLRRPPLTTLSPKAHDMVREATVLAGLESTGVPVPVVVGLERTPPIGPFYVMEYVAGTIARDAATAGMLSLQARAQAGRELARVLATMHAVDPTTIGIGDPARGSGYLARQIALFRRQALLERERPLPLAGPVAEALLARVPTTHRVSLVHGDYRLNNVIVDPATGEVLAVLDWELSALGDPLADLGGLLVHWVDPGDVVRPFSDSPTAVEGFTSRAEVVATYLEHAGLPADTDVTYYHAFASWRLAIALDGVHRRFTGGAYGSTGEEHVRELPQVIPQLIREAARLLSL